VQLPSFVERADVTGVKPAVGERRPRLFGSVEIAARDVLAPHQNLAVLGDPHLDAGDRLADGAPRRAERMIQGHDRRRLGQPIPLDHQEAEPAPERFELGIERRRADHHRPELEAEQAMDAAVLPPSPGPVHRRRGIRSLGGDAQHVLFQHLENFGHAHQDRDPAAADLADDVLGCVASGEHDDAGEHRRDERRHRLAEHVTERKEIEKPERQERLRPLLVLRHLVLDRHDVGEDVAMADHDPLRLGGRAGGKDDFGGGVGGDRRGMTRSGMTCRVRLQPDL
jgi:hypothetical protein